MDQISLVAASVASGHTRLDRSVYADPHLYEEEQRRIFGRCWQFVGHESQVARRGDFVQSRMGEERVVLTRSHDNSLHVLVNSCSHRGTEVCAAERGNVTVLTCPYHAWSFELDGALHRVPFAETLGADIDRREWGLATAAHVESYKGLVFATFDPQAPPLTESLGDARYYLDMMVDRRDDGMVVIGTQRWKHPGNWKLPVESATGDFYHVKFAHSSAAHASPAIAASVGAMSDDKLAKNVAVDGGHGFNIILQPDDADDDARLPVLRRALEDPVLAEYFRRIQPDADERLGFERTRLTLNLGAIFPNLVLMPLSFSIRMSFPDGPNRSETWMWVLGYEDMPDSVRESFVRGYLSGIGPDSLLEPDDMAVWSRIARGVKSRQASQRPLFAGLGAGREHDGPDGTPGRWGHPMSEIGTRNFYRAWTHHMAERGSVNDG